jgi:hypothetical protein
VYNEPIPEMASTTDEHPDKGFRGGAMDYARSPKCHKKNGLDKPSELAKQIKPATVEQGCIMKKFMTL